MSATRWVLVDDKDVGVSYSGGPWFERGDGFGAGNWGLPWRGSQHGTNSSGSVSYEFTGTRIRVFGTSAVRRGQNGAFDPTWTCRAGSTEIRPNDPFTAPINNWPLCESQGLPAGRHTFTLNTATTEGTTFWFDQIRYLPLANMSSSLSGSVSVLVEHTDGDIKYVSGSWQDLTTNAKMTLQAGSVMTARFTGTKLTWVAWTPAGYPTGTSQASYSIDNGPATTFEIRGLPDDSAALFNQHLFETPDLPAGEHTITVTHNGPAAPLTLDHLIISNGDIILPPGSGAGSEGNLDPAAGGNNNSKDGPPIGLIAGAAGGGVAFIIICVLVYILLRRRSKRNTTLNRINVNPSMFPPPIAQVTPFVYDAKSGSAYTGSQTHLGSSSPHTAGWAPLPTSEHAANHQFTPLRKDHKSRNASGGYSRRPDIPLQEMGATYPPAPFSDTSSSSRSGGFNSQNPPSHRRFRSDEKSASGLATQPTTQHVHHEDSGIRLRGHENGRPAPVQVVDVPPSYTPS